MHVMKIYSYYNYKDFILCLGYKQELFKKYFCDFQINTSDIKINLMQDNRYKRVIHFLKSNYVENIDVSLIDTGLNTQTGGRLLQIRDYVDTLRGDDIFMCTYGDGVSDINIDDLIKFHKSHGKIATMTAVKKHGKFGVIQLDDNIVTSFNEKPVGDNYINGGFFVFNKSIYDYLIDDDLPLTLEIMAKDKQLMAYKHTGFWECMDTIRDREYLENLCKEGKAFWKVWEEK